MNSVASFVRRSTTPKWMLLKATVVFLSANYNFSRDLKDALSPLFLSVVARDTTYTDFVPLVLLPISAEKEDWSLPPPLGSLRLRLLSPSLEEVKEEGPRRNLNHLLLPKTFSASRLYDSFLHEKKHNKKNIICKWYEFHLHMVKNIIWITAFGSSRALNNAY